MTLAQLQLVLHALEGVRKVNATVNKMQTGGCILVDDDSARMLSKVRVELSIAAGLLSLVVDQETSGETAGGPVLGVQPNVVIMDELPPEGRAQ